MVVRGALREFPDEDGAAGPPVADSVRRAHTRCVLVFIDESGDPGFKIQRGSTPAFTAVLVAFEDVEQARLTQKAIEATPNDWMLRLNYGQLLIECDRAEEAREQYQHALTQLRHLFSARLMLGNLELKVGNPQSAQRHFRAALRLDPDNANAHSGLAWALDGQGKKTEALTLIEKQVRRNPNRAVLLVTLGRFLYQAGKLDEAKARFTQALEQEPTNPAIHVDLGTTALDQGDTEEAITRFEEALRLQPEWPQLRAHLGEIRKNRNQAKAKGSDGP